MESWSRMSLDAKKVAVSRFVLELGLVVWSILVPVAVLNSDRTPLAYVLLVLWLLVLRYSGL